MRQVNPTIEQIKTKMVIKVGKSIALDCLSLPLPYDFSWVQLTKLGAGMQIG